MGKVSLPLQKLNDLMDGGVEEGSNVLILADLVVDKSKFASALMNYRLERDDSLVYFVNNRLPKFVRDYIKDEERYDERITFIDGFSSTIEKESEEEFVIEADTKEDKETYIEEGIEVAKEALEEIDSENSMFVLDSLDSWIGSWDEMGSFLGEVKDTLEENGTVAYYLLPNLGFEEEDGSTFDRLMEMFDYVIHLKGLERSGRVLKYVHVRKPDIETKVPFDVTPKGIVMYIPKILVTGPFNAGKSTTIQNMSDEAVSVDRLGTTVALDHGKVERAGIKADLFGTPGQKRFDWALEFLGQSMFGCFIVVDSRNPDYERAKEMRERLRQKGIPTIVLANFKNHKGALPVERIEEEMELDTIAVDALEGEGLEEALEELFEKILGQHSWYYV